MRALWTLDEAAYDGEFVSFGPSWAWPKPVQPHVPVLIGAGGGPKTFAWIARTADGWMTTPIETGIADKAEALRRAWADAERSGSPEIHVLVAKKPTSEDFAEWAQAGVTELIWGIPDAEPDAVLAYLDKLAGRLGTSTGGAGPVAPGVA